MKKFIHPISLSFIVLETFLLSISLFFLWKFFTSKKFEEQFGTDLYLLVPMLFTSAAVTIFLLVILSYFNKRYTNEKFSFLGIIGLVLGMIAGPYLTSLLGTFIAFDKKSLLIPIMFSSFITVLIFNIGLRIPLKIATKENEDLH